MVGKAFVKGYVGVYTTLVTVSTMEFLVFSVLLCFAFESRLAIHAVMMYPLFKRLFSAIGAESLLYGWISM